MKSITELSAQKPLLTHEVPIPDLLSLSNVLAMLNQLNLANVLFAQSLASSAGPAANWRLIQSIIGDD